MSGVQNLRKSFKLPLKRKFESKERVQFPDPGVEEILFLRFEKISRGLAPRSFIQAKKIGDTIMTGNTNIFFAGPTLREVKNVEFCQREVGNQ
jgi:hypothetical protein